MTDAPPPEPAPESAPDPEGTVITSPMVGTFYSSPSPDSQPFVRVGTKINSGDTICIIEAMKVMNPIRAPKSGRVASIMVTNGDPVEYDELLLIID